MTTRVMVLWSGGVESTSMMKWILSEKDWIVHAHFIRYENPEGRLAHEQRAIATLTPLLKGIRDFEYSESFVTIADGKGLPLDYTIHYVIGGAAMIAQNCKNLFRAGALEDEWFHLKDGNNKLHLIKHPVIGDLHRKRAEILTHILPPIYDPHIVAPWINYYEHSKAWHVKYLGDLYQHTWSCRTPTPEAGLPCGFCHSCKEREAAERGESYNPDVQEMMRLGIYE